MSTAKGKNPQAREFMNTRVKTVTPEMTLYSLIRFLHDHQGIVGRRDILEALEQCVRKQAGKKPPGFPLPGFGERVAQRFPLHTRDKESGQ